MRIPALAALIGLSACSPEPAAAPAAVAVMPDPVPDRGAPAAVDPLDTLAARLRALPPDPSPAELTNGVHYWASNERRLDLYRPDIDERGGLLVGVGSDQLYAIAAWQGADLVVAVDFDPAIARVHAVHRALVQAADGPADFLALWREPGAERALALLADPGLAATYRDARPEVSRRLDDRVARWAELGVDSWLSDDTLFRRVAQLHRRGRVVALQGDFARPGLVRALAEVLADPGASVSVLYLSNIEQYLTYRRPLRENLLALTSDDSLVLRTLPGRPAGFQYLLQRGADLRAWLRRTDVWTVYAIRGFARGEPLVAGERHVMSGPPAHQRTRDVQPSVGAQPSTSTRGSSHPIVR